MHFCALFCILNFSASGPCNCFCIRECHLPRGARNTGPKGHLKAWNEHPMSGDAPKRSENLKCTSIYCNKNIPQIPQTTPKATYDSQQKKKKRTNDVQVSMVARAAERFQAPPAPKGWLHEIVVETWKRCCCCCCPSLTAFCCIGTLYPSRAREASQIPVSTQTSKQCEQLNRSPKKESSKGRCSTGSQPKSNPPCKRSNYP